MNNRHKDKQIIVGTNSVTEALKAERKIFQIYLAEGVNPTRVNSLVSLAKERNVNVKSVPATELEQIVGDTSHQGVAAVVEDYAYVQFEDLLNRVKQGKKLPLIIMLDKLEDPHNLGAIIRTADAVAADGIIIPNKRSVGLTTTVAKVSVGAIEHVPVSQVTNLVQTVDRLKKEGFWVVGADASGDQIYTDIDYNMPICLVIGGEGRGISQLLLKNCDFVAKLPMAGHVNSLNASVATSIFLYEIFRQREYLYK